MEDDVLVGEHLQERNGVDGLGIDEGGGPVGRLDLDQPDPIFPDV